MNFYNLDLHILIFLHAEMQKNTFYIHKISFKKFLSKRIYAISHCWVPSKNANFQWEIKPVFTVYKNCDFWSKFNSNNIFNDEHKPFKAKPIPPEITLNLYDQMTTFPFFIVENVKKIVKNVLKNKHFFLSLFFAFLLKNAQKNY